MKWTWPLLPAFLFSLSAAGQLVENYWYYCDPLKAYFPYVRSCPVPWRKVAPPPIATPAPTARPTQIFPAQPAPAYQPGSPDPGAEQAAQAARAAEQQRQEAAAAAAKADADRKAKLEAQREQDEADGYKQTTVADIRLDYKVMGESTKIIVSGYYSTFGQVAFLSENPMSSSLIDVMADDLPRDLRKQLLDCENCYVTIWAHYGCTSTILNQPTATPCFIADRLKMGGYGIAE